jgi:hypothetical protein
MMDVSGLLKITVPGANMLYTLFVWGFVTTHGSGWRPLAEFHGLAKCEAAAKELQLKPNAHRCIQTK